MNRLFFISRPRRFGKSLTLSVLKALFAGHRELFEGLYIDKADWKWEKYPVIHFEFNDVTTTSIADFETSFAIHVQERLEKAGFAYDKSLPPPENFGHAIESLSAANGGKGVVILIDEYDAPVGHALGNIDMAEAIRDRMSALYSRMKNRTGDIRFLLMTGISKFTRLSVFSALSNLVDVSQDDAYATMFGYTEEELSANFEEHLRAHAEKMGRLYDEYRAEMKKWYNGFRFAKNDETTVYNPISVALTLFRKEPGGFSATLQPLSRGLRRGKDIVASHKKGIYIFELKVDEPVDKAFAQIRRKKYAEPYLADDRPIWLIGLSFDSKTRCLVDCAAEMFQH